MRDYSDRQREHDEERQRERQEAENDAAAEYEMLKAKAELADEMSDIFARKYHTYGGESMRLAMMEWIAKYDKLA